MSVWVRDVPFDEPVWRTRVGERRTHGWAKPGPNVLSRRKQDEIDRLRLEGHDRIGRLTEREFLVAGAMLYAGEGDKARHEVGLANTDPRMIAFFLAWLRHFFEIDEARLRVRIYLHEGLDIEAATEFWAAVTAVPVEQFGAPYRAVADPSIRRSKHPMGCPKVRYCSATTLRTILGLIDALLSCESSIPG